MRLLQDITLTWNETRDAGRQMWPAPLKTKSFQYSKFLSCKQIFSNRHYGPCRWWRHVPGKLPGSLYNLQINLREYSHSNIAVQAAGKVGKVWIMCEVCPRFFGWVMLLRNHLLFSSLTWWMLCFMSVKSWAKERWWFCLDKFCKQYERALSFVRECPRICTARGTRFGCNWDICRCRSEICDRLGPL